MKKILIITERRADYSKFRQILFEIKKSKKLDYFLVVSGSHLLKKHGYTINEIKKDGFKISKSFNMYDEKFVGTNSEMCMALGNCILNLTKIIKKLKPDLVLSGFDIGANLAAAIVGAHMNTVVAHIEGGDVTGSIDESIRHAITKFSHIHFTSNVLSTKRLVKMGENKKFIFTVGSPAIDNIKKIKRISKNELEEYFGVALKSPFFILIQHPVTSEINMVDKNMKIIINAIAESNIPTIMIDGNADAGSKKISQSSLPSNFKIFSTIDNEKFVNLLQYATCLIGNSSTGIIETPFLHVPSINIGTRQNNRLHSNSTIDIGYNKKEIKSAIDKILKDKKFNKKIQNTSGLYGNGNSSKKIISILEKLDLNSVPIQKELMY